MMPVARKAKKLRNFEFAVGYGMNWADLDTGIMYHIQEYKEALDNPNIPKEEKPTKIRMTKLSNGEELGWVDALIVAQKMKDPEPDPRY